MSLFVDSSAIQNLTIENADRFAVVIIR